MIIGIITILLTIVSVTSVLLYRYFTWKKEVPTVYIDGIGIKYVQGATEWPGLERTISVLRKTLNAKYGELFTSTFLDGIWIEIVGPDGVRITRSTIVSEFNKIVGSIDFSQLFPWTREYRCAIVLKRDRYKTADQGAIFHEIVKHLLPLYRKQGLNFDHSLKEYNDLENQMLASIKRMKELNE